MATTCLGLAWDGAGQTPETRVGVWRGLAVGMARYDRFVERYGRCREARPCVSTCVRSYETGITAEWWQTVSAGRGGGAKNIRFSADYIGKNAIFAG